MNDLSLSALKIVRYFFLTSVLGLAALCGLVEPVQAQTIHLSDITDVWGTVSPPYPYPYAVEVDSPMDFLSVTATVTTPGNPATGGYAVASEGSATVTITCHATILNHEDFLIGEETVDVGDSTQATWGTNSTFSWTFYTGFDPYAWVHTLAANNTNYAGMGKVKIWYTVSAIYNGYKVIWNGNMGTSTVQFTVEPPYEETWEPYGWETFQF